MSAIGIIALLLILISPIFLFVVGARTTLGALGYRRSSGPDTGQIKDAYRQVRERASSRSYIGGPGAVSDPDPDGHRGYSADTQGRASRKPPRPTKWSIFGEDLPGEMIVVVAGPGSGKNQTVLRPASWEILALRDEHLIISDAKAEEVDALLGVGALADAYRYTFDPSAPDTSSVNPVSNPTDAAAFLGAIYRNPQARETFWQDSALDLALAIAKATEYRSLLTIYDALRSPRRLDELAVESEDVDVAWAQQEERTRNNIRATALAPLSPLREEHVRRVFKPGADQAEFGPDHRDVVVMEPPVSASSAAALGPLLGGLYDYFFRQATEGYRRHGIGCYHLIDEAASVMKIDNIANYLNTGRGLGQNLMVVLQDLGQLEAKIGQGEARSVIGSCDIRIFGRTGDYATAKLFSDMSGSIHVSRRVFQDSDAGGFTQALNDLRGTTVSHLHEQQRARVLPEDLLGLEKFCWFVFATSADEIELVCAMPFYQEKSSLPMLADPEEFDLLGITVPTPNEAPPQPEAEERADEAPEAEDQPTAAMPVRCPECEQELREGANFCQRCGHRLVTPVTVFCWQCGAKNTDREKDCRECGESLV